MIYLILDWPESQEFSDKEDSELLLEGDSRWAVPAHHFPQEKIENEVAEYFKDKEASDMIVKLMYNSDPLTVLNELSSGLKGYKRIEFIEALKEKYIELS